MKIYPIVLSASRPKPTVQITLASLQNAGWESVRVFDGTPKSGKGSPIGCTMGNVYLMEAILAEKHEEEALLIIEDDVIFCKGVRRYLEATEWPVDPSKLALISPYCPIAYSNHTKPYGTNGPWHREIRGLHLSGSQAWIYPMQQLPGIITAIRQIPHGVDRAVGTYAEEVGLEVWYHTPSLAQHIGLDNNSAVGNGDCGEVYRSDTFPGEEYEIHTNPCS